MNKLLNLIIFIIIYLPINTYSQNDEDYFEILSASSFIREEVYFLDAWIDYRISEETIQALESGVNLLFTTEVEFVRKRFYWLDAVDASLIQTYQLEYNALIQRYVIFNQNSGTQNYFVTLFSALNYIGRINELPLIDASLLEADYIYDVRIRTSLTIESLRSVLMLMQFWRNDSVQSDWYRWQL